MEQALAIPLQYTNSKGHLGCSSGLKVFKKGGNKALVMSLAITEVSLNHKISQCSLGASVCVEMVEEGSLAKHKLHLIHM